MFSRSILLLISLVLCSSVFAQNIIPDGFSFQAIAKDINGNIAPKRPVYIQAEIIRGTTGPVSVYTEIHQVNTTAEGIFTIIVGRGTLPSSNFSGIKWSDAIYSLKIKMAITPVDPPLGWRYQDAFIDAGTVQLLSVPYAKVAGNGLDSTKVFFLRDTSSVLKNYVRKDSLPAYLNNKLNIADSLIKYVTPTQLKNIGYDTAQMLSGYIRKNNAVTSISIDSANGVSGTVKNPNSTPALTIKLGDITPLSITSTKGRFDTLRVDSLLIAPNIKGTLLTGAQPNIISIGQLTNLSVSGTIYGGTFSGTLDPGMFNNITSLGTLAALTVSGNITSNTLSVSGGKIGNLSVPGTLTAVNANLGSITGLNALTVNGTINSSNLAVTTNATIGGNLTVTGNATAANLYVPGTIIGGMFSGTLSPALLASISSSGVFTNITVTGFANIGTLSGSLLTSNQPNITTVGTLTALTVNGTTGTNNLIVSNNTTVGGNITATGNITSANMYTPGTLNATSVLVGGNLTVTGNATAANLYVPGTIIGGTFSGTLSSTALNTITSLNNLQNLTVVNNISAATINASGTIAAGTLSGSLTGTLTSANQPNITSLGRLGNLSVNGTVEGGTFSGTLSSTALNTITSLGNVQNLTVANNITAATISTSGSVRAGSLSATNLTVTSSQATRYSAIMNNVTAAASVTVDLSKGNVVSIPLASTSIGTLTFSNPTTNPASYIFKISYSTATALTIAWPASIKWASGTAPVLTCATGKTDIISFIFDGTSYYGTYALNF